MPEFYMIPAQIIIKISKFFIFARKTPEFYIIIARKIFFPDFFFGGGCTCPVSYAYAKKNTFLTKKCAKFLYFFCRKPCLGGLQWPFGSQSPPQEDSPLQVKFLAMPMV